MVESDKEEKDLVDSYERDEWQSVADQGSEFERYRDYARSASKKDTRVNIRLSKKD